MTSECTCPSCAGSPTRLRQLGKALASGDYETAEELVRQLSRNKDSE